VTHCSKAILKTAIPASAVRLAAGSLTPRQKKLFPPQDLGLLSAPDRDDWNKPDLIMDVLGIADGAVVADLGAGGGWFTIRLARRVGPNGLVYAQDIQPQMIEAINRRVQQEALSNVRTVLGTPTDPRLPGGLDAVLIVDAYREMDEPGKPEVLQGLLRRIDDALKPQGRVGIVDFLPGGGGPGPSSEDRVKPETIKWFSGTQDGLQRPTRIDFELPGVTLTRMPLEQDMGPMLETGDIDAIISPNAPKALGRPDSPVRRLFQDYRNVEESFLTRQYKRAESYFYHAIMPSRNEQSAIIFCGTMGMLRKRALVDAGGWNEKCITEDAELSVRLLNDGWRSLYLCEDCHTAAVTATGWN